MFSLRLTQTESLSIYEITRNSKRFHMFLCQGRTISLIFQLAKSGNSNSESTGLFGKRLKNSLFLISHKNSFDELHMFSFLSSLLPFFRAVNSPR